MTKEERREYYLKNIEKIKAAQKISRDKNKEKRKEYDKQYYLANKEKIKQKVKDFKANQKDGYHRVYLLEDYNYVGVSDNLWQRFANHKSQFNRDCTNHRVLYKTKDRDEALELEALLHDMGYEGKHQFNRYA
jgi:predicted GIY-YIG superfamily endonuclease